VPAQALRWDDDSWRRRRANWFFHSALPIVGIRKLTERYDAYLKSRRSGSLQAIRTRPRRLEIEFQRNLTKYVGAPLLGAFSVAAGATLIASAFSGATVTGLREPASGRQSTPQRDLVFANGVVCISRRVSVLLGRPR
jgi:hypothetical protein